jgi:hypothetical protein
VCSIILSIGEAGVFIAANRDEMVARPWEPPAEYWPGICGGRDTLAGGTWLALNQNGVAASVLNREGTLGPAPGKRSRGELPLLALLHSTAREAAEALAALDAGLYRSFNLVVADVSGAFFLRGLGAGAPGTVELPQGVSMITSGEPNDISLPRIARHLPRFRAASVEDWGRLLADSFGERAEQLNIPAQENGFGTVCASLISLPRHGMPAQQFAAGPPGVADFYPVLCPV